jgi:hypothetical protein
MDEIKNGGPVFPVHAEVMSDCFGLSARDWFAGQALIAIFAVPDAYGSPQGMAAAAYKIADAMLAAREADPS